MPDTTQSEVCRWFVPGVPIPQGSMRAFNVKGCKAPIITSDNTKLKPWRSQVALFASQAWKGPPTIGPVALTVTFCLRKPQATSKHERYHAKRPDIDKLIRAIMDALTSVIWYDDGQVVSVAAEKRYSDRVGAEILVWIP